MRLVSIFFIMAATGLLAACHQPMATPKPPTFQSSEITVRDWKNAAHDVKSELVLQRLVADPWQPGSATGPFKPIFVEVVGPGSGSLFLREAADELVGDILRSGGSISPSPNPYQDTVVSLAVDVVPWTHGDLHTSNTEAVLKATVVSEGQLRMKLVEPVYVRDGDLALYQPSRPMVLPVRLLRYGN